MVLVPENWWGKLFVTHETGSLRLVENAVVGPLIGAASFACSCGNNPARQRPLVGRHQLWRRYFVHLRGLDHHSADSDLPEILWSEGRTLYHQHPVCFHGNCRHRCGFVIWRARVDSARLSARHHGPRFISVELYHLAGFRRAVDQRIFYLDSFQEKRRTRLIFQGRGKFNLFVEQAA